MKRLLLLIGLIRCAIGIAAIMAVAAIVLSWGMDLLSRPPSVNVTNAEAAAPRQRSN